MKTYAADPTGLTVYATGGAPRYHSSRTCRALLSGQDLNDWDCWDDYCNHHLHRTPRTIRETDLAGAVAAGKWPCHTCYPAPTVIPPSQDDFGHWPTKGISLLSLSEDVCQRCTEWGVWYGNADDLRPVHIPWPCTSAIVLGLVPRPLP